MQFQNIPDPSPSLKSTVILKQGGGWGSETMKDTTVVATPGMISPSLEGTVVTPSARDRF